MMMTKAPVIAFVKQCALQLQQKVNDFTSDDLLSNWFISGTEDVHTQSHGAKYNVHQLVLKFESGETSQVKTTANT